MPDINIIEILTKSEGKELIDLFIKHKVSIFGGCIRDIIAGDKINDIDLCVNVNNIDDIHKDLINLNYAVDNDGYLISPNKLSLDITYSKVDPDDTSDVLGPLVNVDFDVNLLGYSFHKNNLYKWASQYYNIEIDEIIRNIKNKECIKFVYFNNTYDEYKQSRENKIIKKVIT